MEFMEDFNQVYDWENQVYRVYDSAIGIARVIKLTDDQYFFQAKHVAGEILQAIDGRTKYAVIVAAVAAQYDPKHRDEIMAKARELLAKLFAEELIRKV